MVAQQSLPGADYQVAHDVVADTGEALYLTFAMAMKPIISEHAPVPSKTSMPLCLKPARIASCDSSSKLFPIAVAIGKVFVYLERKRPWDSSRGVVWLCSRRVVEVWSR